ncbi:MAG: SUMF1/EgtB/PvdO family nonheme iron enzyme, partial [Candidatus Wallbacteria bacterium]|nr:SUMF1/EgtB/PvdO family nonheme iron enzyme [Candidatus Wallbacteria bacterium]
MRDFLSAKGFKAVVDLGRRRVSRGTAQMTRIGRFPSNGCTRQCIWDSRHTTDGGSGLRDWLASTSGGHALAAAVLLFACVGRLQAGGVPARLAVTNVSSDNASVLWVSPDVETGTVELAESIADLEARTGSFRSATDDAGPALAHHVTLGDPAHFDNRVSAGRPGLAPGRNYFFDIVSGGVRFDDSGRHFTFRTSELFAPRLVFPEPASVGVLTPSTDASGAALLTYHLESAGARSQEGSAPVIDGVARLLDLAQLLSEDLTVRWDFTGTQELVLTASGEASAAVTTVRVTVQANRFVKRLSTIVLPGVNRAPLVDAGADVPGLTGRAVLLRGSASDPDSDPLTLLWTELPDNPATVTLTAPATLTPSFTPPVAGSYRFQLAASDGRGGRSTDAVTILASDPDTAPNDHASGPAQTAGPDTLVEAATPGVGVELAGVLAITSEEDWFRFHAEPGRVYQLWIRSEGLSGASAAIVALDGTSVLVLGSVTGGADLTLGEFRPKASGTYFARLTGADAADVGAYRVRMGVRTELLARAPPAFLVTTSPQGSLRASVRTGSTTIPLSELRLLIAYDAATMRQPSVTAGAGVGAFALTTAAAAPAHLELVLRPREGELATPPSAVGAELGVLDFPLRLRGTPPRDAVTVLSVSASNLTSSVRALRPSADAGLPQGQAAIGAEPIALNGRRSTTAAGPSAGLAYRWSQTVGPDVTLSQSQSPVASFIAGQAGHYGFALAVSDGSLDAASALVTVRAGSPPEASIEARLATSLVSGDATTRVLDMVVGQALSLDGGSSLDRRTGRPVSYSWSQVEGPPVLATSQSPTVTFSPSAAGLYRVELTALDGDGVGSRPASVRMRVRAEGEPAPVFALTAVSGARRGDDLGDSPEFASGVDLRTQAGQRITLSAVADPPRSSAEKTSFYWTEESGPYVTLAQRGGLENSDRNDSYADLTPMVAGVYRFRCRLRRQPSGFETERSIRVIVVSAAARVPSAVAAVELPGTASAGTSVLAAGTVVRLVGSAPSTSASPVSYRWVQVAGPSAALSNPATAVTTFAVPDLPGEKLYAFHLFADDGLRSPPSVVAVRVDPGVASDATLTLHQGLNAVSLPVQAGGSAGYSVADLARDTGSPFVAWTQAGGDGKGRFKVWLRGLSLDAPGLEPAAGYLVSRRPSGPGQLSFVGPAWPSDRLVRALVPGLNLLGLAASVNQTRDAADLLQNTGGRFAVRWAPGPLGVTRPEPYIAAGDASAFLLEGGRAYLVFASAGSVDVSRFAKGGAASGDGAPPTGAAYDLPAGWTLISLAADSSPAYERASDLVGALAAAGAQVTRLARFDGAAFEEYVASPAPGGTDFRVGFGEAYAALSSSPAPGTVLTGGGVAGSAVQLSEGFNLIGSTLDATVGADALLQSIQAQGGEGLVVMRLAGSRFLSHLLGVSDLSSQVSLSRGGGVAVYATRASQLILGQPAAPTLLGTRLPEGAPGVSYAATLAVTGTPPFTWSLLSGALPPGLTLTADGSVAGTPTAAGAFVATVRVSNPGGSVERVYTISIVEPPAGTRGLAAPEAPYLELENLRDSSRLVAIPAAAFQMGSSTASVAAGLALTDEAPQHPVGLSRFYIGKYEVTNAQYARFLADTKEPTGPATHFGHHPDEPPAKDHTPEDWDGATATPWSTSADSPVVGVDWYDAYAYCAWAGVRLPTEAELEFASRGSDGRVYPWGTQAIAVGGAYKANSGNLDICCFGDAADGHLYAAPVGSYGPGARAPRANGESPFGVLDLVGNAWEWGLDWYEDDHYAASAARDPAGPASGLYRVQRGGSWYNSSGFQRATYRGLDSPGSRFGSYGLRVARSHEPAILTTSLPAARESIAYQTTFAAAGTAAVAWSLEAGSLPPGLALDPSGRIAGTPSISSVVRFTLRARSSAGFDERSFVLAVDPPGAGSGRFDQAGFREVTNDVDGSRLIALPRATVTMGSTTAQVDAAEAVANETPAHAVTVSPVYIGRFEVTNGQYAAFLAATGDARGAVRHEGHHPDEPPAKDHTPLDWTGAGSTPWSTSPDGPVVGVDWYDAYADCARAGLRLPSEAELEYSARATDARTGAWGSGAVDAGSLVRASSGALTACCSEDASDGFLYAAPAGSFGAEAACRGGVE